MNSFNVVFRVSFTAALLLSSMDAFRMYRQSIPNGYRVRDPCPPYRLVYGVGHVNKMGSGGRNSFGKMFAAEDYEWTVKLCQADSDGDGLTNGYELGDEYCLWKTGDTPSRTTNITSPGIIKKFDKYDFTHVTDIQNKGDTEY